MEPRERSKPREPGTNNSLLPKTSYNAVRTRFYSRSSSRPPTNHTLAALGTPPYQPHRSNRMKNDHYTALSHPSHHRYTSLGERSDTAKNEALRLPDGRYRPAYELAEQEEHLERSPRTPVASPRSPTCDHDSGDGDGGGSGGESGGGRGDRNKRFSSWDKEWDALDADSADEGTLAAACAAGGTGARAGAGGGRGGVISVDARSSEGGKVLVGVTANSVGGGVACRPPDGSNAPGGGGGGGGGLTGWVGSWLPLTTIAAALVLTALGVRSSSESSSRGGEYDGAPEKGD